MICKVDGHVISPSQIGPPAMNFGQNQRYEGYVETNYTYTFTVSEFIDLFKEWFDEFRHDALADDKNLQTGDFPVYDHFRDCGFPTLAVLIADYPSLLSEIIIFHDLDILNLIDMSTSEKSMKKLYLINSLDWAKIDNLVSIGGVAFINIALIN